jgi:hypothetical protein
MTWELIQPLKISSSISMTTCRRCFVLFFGLALLLSACAPKIAPNTEQQALAEVYACEDS